MMALREGGVRVSPKSLLYRPIAEGRINVRGFKPLEHEMHGTDPPYLTPSLAKVLEMPEAIFIDQAIAQVAQLGRINQAVNPA